MRSIAIIVLCMSAGMPAQPIAPAAAQIYKGGEPILKSKPDPDTVAALLMSTPGCQRHGKVTYDDIAKELSGVARNAACRNYKPLPHQCRGKSVWDHRYTYPLPDALWAGTAPANFTVAQQEQMLAQARAAAVGMTAPPGTRLYRLTFLTKNVGIGPHPTQRIMGEVHYGVCSSGIS